MKDHAMSDILYMRNPFRDTSNTAAERAWDILYERYQSQYDNEKGDYAMYDLPSLEDVFSYVRLKEQFDKNVEHIKALLIPIDVKLKLHQMQKQRFDDAIEKLSLKKG